MKKKIAIQMDYIESIDFDYDSSFMIANEAQKRGYEIFYYNPKDLFLDGNQLKAKGYFLELSENREKYFNFLTDKIVINLEIFKFVFLRQDPPFNMTYITSTYLLDCLPRSVIVINNPTAVRNATEKIFPINFYKFMPKTIISNDIMELKNFLDNNNDIVIKPLYGNGGEGIFRVNPKNFDEIINNYNFLDLPIVAQKFIPEIKYGDRRIILLDGEYVGSVARIPEEGSIKANFHAGGSAQKTDLVFRDEEIIREVGKELKNKNLFFVGIDIIGEYLTEINVTSPTGIKQINSLNNIKIESIFWDKLEEKYKLV